MKRHWILPAAALSLLAAASGCAMTPETICERTAKALAETPVTTMEGGYSCTVTMADAASGIRTDMDLAVDLEERITAAPQTIYMKMDMDISAMGISLPIQTETYCFQQEGTAYTRVGDLWTREELPDAGMDPVMAEALWTDMADKLTLDRETVPVGNAEAYRLSGTLDGTAMQGLLDSVVESMLGAVDRESGQQEPLELMGQMDMSAVAVDTVILVDTESFLPVQEELTIRGLDAALAPLWEGTDTGVSVSIADGMTANITLGYKPVDPIILPEEAEAAAARYERLQQGDPDNGDGTYTIQESGIYLDVRTPEGYTLQESDYDRVLFYNEQTDRAVQYQLYYIEPYSPTLEDVPFLEQQDLYSGDADGVCQVYRMGTTQVADCVWADILTTVHYDPYELTRAYVWTKISDAADGMEYWLMLTVEDGGNNRDTDYEGLNDIGMYAENLALGSPGLPPFGGTSLQESLTDALAA